MAPFSIPAPSIIALRLPVFGGPKSIDTNTKIQLLCETYLEHEVYYTLDGTKPQPYAGIVQGNKTIKYSSPFCLPAGKISIRALAIHANVHTMCSSVVTKRFDVLKVDSDDDDKSNTKTKQRSNSKLEKKLEVCENKKNLNGKMVVPEEKISDITISKLESVKEETILDCFEEAFIGGSDFDIENSDPEDSIEDESGFPVDEDELDANGNIEESEEAVSHDADGASYERDSVFEAMEKLVLEDEKSMVKSNITLIDSGTSIDTQFCCLKCDLTLQLCISCNKMNAVSSKFCIGCGKQLLETCYFCKETNPSVAIFCQYCGKKLGTRLEPFIKVEEVDVVDHSVMAKPQLRNASIQSLILMVDKGTQTMSDRSPFKKSPDMKRIPRHSPGRGYWHQQLDYICNHLKSHAYNNVEFRKEISEPSLCDFKSARVTKDEDNVTVTVIFTPLVIDKSGLASSEETKSKDKAQDST